MPSKNTRSPLLLLLNCSTGDVYQVNNHICVIINCDKNSEEEIQGTVLTSNKFGESEVVYKNKDRCPRGTDSWTGILRRSGIEPEGGQSRTVQTGHLHVPVSRKGRERDRKRKCSLDLCLNLSYIPDNILLRDSIKKLMQAGSCHVDTRQVWVHQFRFQVG